jgi:WD40 repeat protein
MEGHTDSITAMVLDEFILITGSDDHTIRLWNMRNFTPSGVVGTHGDAIQDMILIKESGLLVACS